MLNFNIMFHNLLCDWYMLMYTSYKWSTSLNDIYSRQINKHPIWMDAAASSNRRYTALRTQLAIDVPCMSLSILCMTMIPQTCKCWPNSDMTYCGLLYYFTHVIATFTLRETNMRMELNASQWRAPDMRSRWRESKRGSWVVYPLWSCVISWV